MAVQLFSLRGVPDDEAEEVRELLNENNITFYETSAGNCGVSMPAIWLRDDSQLSQAKMLIDAYQTRPTIQQREMYQQLKQDGKHRSFWVILWEQPLKVIAYIGVVLAILYFSTKPFLSLGD